MKTTKAEDDAFQSGLAAHAASFANSLDVKMLAAAEKATRPYFLSYLRAKQQMATYEKESAKMAAKASKYKADADAESKKANELLAAGNREYAEKTIKQAQELMARAQGFAAQAKHFL